MKELTNELAIFRIEVYDYNRWSKPFHMGTVRCGVQTIGNSIRSLYKPIFDRKLRSKKHKRRRTPKVRIGFDDDYDGDSNVNLDGGVIGADGEFQEGKDEGGEVEGEYDDDDDDDGEYDDEYGDDDESTEELDVALFEDAFYGDEMEEWNGGGEVDAGQVEDGVEVGNEEEYDGENDDNEEDDNEKEEEEEEDEGEGESVTEEESDEVGSLKSPPPKTPSLFRRFTNFIGLTPKAEKEYPKGIHV